jgi:hypothetical protein
MFAAAFKSCLSAMIAGPVGRSWKSQRGRSQPSSEIGAQQLCPHAIGQAVVANADTCVWPDATTPNSHGIHRVLQDQSPPQLLVSLSRCGSSFCEIPPSPPSSDDAEPVLNFQPPAWHIWPFAPVSSPKTSLDRAASVPRAAMYIEGFLASSQPMGLT